MGELLQFPQPVDFGERFSERILARLAEAEAHEPNRQFRSDYHIAFRTVLHSARGDVKLCTPHVLATNEVLGCHPDHVFRILSASRIAKLGREYSRWFDDAGNLRPSYLDVPDYDPSTGFLLPRIRIQPKGGFRNGSY